MVWGKRLGYIVLIVGVGLLVFTFFTAFGFFGSEHSIFGSSNLLVIATKTIYLGLMGWIGALLTKRARQTLKSLKKKAEAKPRKRMSEKTETIILLLVLGLLLLITYLGGRLLGTFA